MFLVVGSPARHWYSELPVATKASLSALEAAFTAYFPSMPFTAPTEGEMVIKLLKMRLSDAELGTLVKTAQGEVDAHVVFATKLLGTANRIKNTAGLVPAVMMQLPITVRLQLKSTYSSFKELHAAMISLEGWRLEGWRLREYTSRSRIDNEIEELKRQIEELKQKIASFQ